MMNRSELRIAFLGTPAFALPSLQMLMDEGYNIVQVITQPDRPKGRGHKLSAPPVKRWAAEHDLPVWQPEKLSSADNVERLARSGINLMITAAYGQILTQPVLDIPRYGCINVHASLLPAYRGAAPIIWTIANGEDTAGVTTMRTVRALDAGPILEQDSMAVAPSVTGGELEESLSRLGAETLSRTLAKLLRGELRETPQDESRATYYPVPPRGFGQIDWNQPVHRILDFIRALAPAPGAYVVLPGGERVRVYEASARAGGGAPGQIVSRDPDSGLLIAAADGLVSLDVIKRAGARQMPAAASLRGRPVAAERVEPWQS